MAENLRRFLAPAVFGLARFLTVPPAPADDSLDRDDLKLVLQITGYRKRCQEPFLFLERHEHQADAHRIAVPQEAVDGLGRVANLYRGRSQVRCDPPLPEAFKKQHDLM